MSGRDVDNAILELYGIETEEAHQNSLLINAHVAR
jgi:hypothetical protein